MADGGNNPQSPRDLFGDYMNRSAMSVSAGRIPASTAQALQWWETLNEFQSRAAKTSHDCQMPKLIMRFLKMFVILGALLAQAHVSMAVSLAWTASPSSGVAGYRIYYGGTSGIYTNMLDVGNVTTASVSGLTAGVTYYFTVVAYNASIVLSDFSNEINYTPATSTPATGGSGSGSGTGGSGGTPTGGGGGGTTTGGSSSTYVTSQTLRTTKNDFSGFAGMQFSVGSTPITVTALGRLAAPGNGGTHLVKLVNASDGTDVPGGAVSVSLIGSIAGQFRYASLATPVVLSPGSAYYVVSQELSGGDAWYYDDSTITTTAAATETSGVWGYGAGQWYQNGSFGQTYGPVDFKYSQTGPAQPQTYITSRALGSLRSGYSGFAGMQIFVGAAPMSVTALGRLAAPGNGGTHLMKLVDASDGTDVPGSAVTVSMNGSSAGQFQYANLSNPVMLAASSAYYVLSQETSSGDLWYYNDTTVQTTPVATEISGAWGYGLGQWYLNGGAGQTYGPVDLKYTPATSAQAQRYILGQTLGAAHNDFSGFAGMQIVVGPNPITVTALGRIVAGGNGNSHAVKLVNGNDGTDVPGGAVSVSTSGGTVGQFQYANLSNPVVLSAGQTYYVVSQESSGGDVWYYNDTTVTTASVATESYGIWGYGAGQWYGNGTAGKTYGPVDFKYSTSPPPKPQRFLTSENLGTTHNDFSGFAGMQIVVGSSSLTVSALGRMVAGGNSGSHLLKFVRANGTDVAGGSVSVGTSGGVVGQFQYANLSSPLVLAAGKTYYLVSQETSGGDSWYYNDTTVRTTTAATVTAGTWGYGAGQWYLNGSTGQSYGPLDFKYLSNGAVTVAQ